METSIQALGFRAQVNIDLGTYNKYIVTMEWKWKLLFGVSDLGLNSALMRVLFS